MRVYLKTQGLVVVLLAAIAVSGCGKNEATSSSESPPVSEGAVADCQTLEEKLPLVAGSSISVVGMTGEIAPDDSVILADSKAEISAEGLGTAIEEHKTLLTELQGLDITTTELATHRDAYAEKLQALIAEAETAKALYTKVSDTLKPGVETLNPTPEDVALLQTALTDTKSFATQVETLTTEMGAIRDEVVAYCLDAQFSQ